MKSEVLVTQSRPSLCNCVDCSPPGLPVHGILQVRILEWIVTSFSRGSSRPRDRTWVSCITGRFFTIWAPWEALNFANLYVKIFTLCPVLYCFLEEMFQKYFVRKNLCRFFERWQSDYHQNVEVEKEVILAFFSWHRMSWAATSPRCPGSRPRTRVWSTCAMRSPEKTAPSPSFPCRARAILWWAKPTALLFTFGSLRTGGVSALGMSKDGMVGLQLHKYFI